MRQGGCGSGSRSAGTEQMDIPRRRAAREMASHSGYPAAGAWEAQQGAEGIKGHHQRHPSAAAPGAARAATL